PTLIGADVGDVGDPDLVRFTDVELPLQAIGRSHRWLATVIAGTPTIAGLRAQSFSPHQASHAVPATGLPQLTQVVVDLAITVDPTAFQPGMFDQSEQALIFLGAYRFWLDQPGVVTA